MPVYLVERYAPGLDADDLASRLQSATAGLRAQGAHVEWLLSIALPDEDGCLCLFEAPSAEDVRLANERAAAPFDRLVEAVALRGGL